MRKLMCFAIGMTLACLFGVYVSRGALPYLAGAAALGFGLLVWIRKKPIQRIALICLGIGFGSLWFWMFDARKLKPLHPLDGTVQQITLRVTGYSWETEYGSAVDGIVTLEGQTYPVRFYAKDILELEPGALLSTSAKLAATDAGLSTQPSFHRTQGIFLLAYQKGALEIQQGSPSWRDAPAVLRHLAQAQVERWIPGEAAAFAKALVLGDGSDLSEQRRMDFSLTGISHVVAVSGLHVSILMELVLMLASHRRIGTALLGIPVLLLFAGITGGSPSMVRATIMQLVALLALLTDREYDPPTALGMAAIGMLMDNPLMVASVSFQLSFAAVAGIFLFQEPLQKWMTEMFFGQKKPPKAYSAVFSAICVTLTASVLTLPLSALYFGVVSLIAPLCNLLILPVVPVVFYGVLLLLVCVGPLALIGKGLGIVLGFAIAYIYRVSELLAGLPVAAVFTRSKYIVLWLVLIYVLLAMILLTRKHRKLAVVLGALGLAVALGASHGQRLLYGCSVTVLDVGQGQCIILQSRGYTFLVDCGGNSESAMNAIYTLKSQGISRLDGLILTHYDRDHVSGVELLSHYIDMDTLFLPRISDEDDMLPQVLAATAESNQRWVEEVTLVQGDGMEITLFPASAQVSSNESGLAVLFQAANCDTLITGDWGMAAERQLLATQTLPQLELLVVGHHGSKYSTCPELLSALNPQLAVISVSATNTYGHPTPEVLERLADHGVTVFRTDQNGDITFRRWGNGS